MNEKALRACPFCGSSEVRLIQIETCWVRCDNCDASGGHKYSEYTEPMKSEAIKAWNTRQESKLTLNMEKIAQILFAYEVLAAGVSNKTISHHWDMYEFKERYYARAKAIKAKEVELLEKAE